MSYMRIAICDDEKMITSMLKRIVNHILKRRNISALVDEFWSGEELLSQEIILCNMIKDSYVIIGIKG